AGRCSRRDPQGDAPPGRRAQPTHGRGRERRPAGPPGGSQGTPGAARVLRASVDRAGRDRADRPPRDPALEREIRHRLADWRAMLRREVPEAREILRNLIVGRIVFKPRPEARVYEFSGRGSFGRLLAGTTSPVSVVTPAGFATVGAHRHVLGIFRVA